MPPARGRRRLCANQARSLTHLGTHMQVHTYQLVAAQTLIPSRYSPHMHSHVSIAYMRGQLQEDRQLQEDAGVEEGVLRGRGRRKLCALCQAQAGEDSDTASVRYLLFEPLCVRLRFVVGRGIFVSEASAH